MNAKAPTKAALALGLLLPALAGAEIYRCTIDGRLTFRDKPCPDQPAQAAAAAPGAAMLGCYRLETAGWESGRQVSILRFLADGPGQYAMVSPDDPAKTRLPMRRATPEELRLAGTALRFPATDGLVMVVPKDTPNMPALPLGLYKGTDAYRDTVYFFYGFMANGSARQVECPK